MGSFQYHIQIKDSQDFEHQNNFKTLQDKQSPPKVK